MFKPNSLQRVMKLNVHAQVIRIQLQLVPGPQSRILIHIHQQRRHAPIHLQLPVPVAFRHRVKQNHLLFHHFRHTRLFPSSIRNSPSVLYRLPLLSISNIVHDPRLWEIPESIVPERVVILSASTKMHEGPQRLVQLTRNLLRRSPLITPSPLPPSPPPPASPSSRWHSPSRPISRTAAPAPPKSFANPPSPTGFPPSAACLP